MLTRDDIQAEYERLGYRHGWSFMACPEERLRTAKVAIVGTNPGGGGEGDTWRYESIWSCEECEGFAFDGRIMRPQVEAWHRVLELEEDETFCAQFIPFRAPDSGRRLPNREEALHFARALWTWVLEVSPATLFITMGRLPFNELTALIGGRTFAHNLPTGYRLQTIDVSDGAGGRTIVRMPHPSYFQLFGRGEPSEEAAASLRIAAGMEP